jgi:hypothetical protein
MSNSKARQVKEIVKCGKDPVYFFNKYVKIQHPVRGLIPFDTYIFQDDCVQDFIDNRFNIILKSRQLGLSTLVAAYATWMAIFQRDKNILVIATKLSVAQNFIKKVKTIIRNIPPWLMLPQIVTNNKQLLEFSHGSTIKAIPTSEDAGRSEALTLLIVDEAAFVRNFDELWMGLYPTISTGGRAIVLSTPNGVGGQYYNLYVDADSGLNEFNAIKLPWDVHPERDQVWFDRETKNFSERKVAQEYLCDFSSSGETFLVANDLEYLRQKVLNPIQKTGPNMNVWIWKHELAESSYIISADVARGDSKDYSSFHVIDVSNFEVVAEYKGKIPPDDFGELLFEFGMKYNKALMIPENNSYGYATLVKLKDLNYPRLYYRKRKSVFIGDYIPPGNVEIAGFTTSGKTRSLILTKLEEVIRNKELKIYSSRFYEEVKTFIWRANRAQAMSGYNDDLVMSLAIGSWLLESSAEYSNTTSNLNDAMLKAMKKTTNSFPVDIPINSSENSSQPHSQGRDSNNPSFTDSKTSSGASQWGKRMMIGDDIDWVLD